MKHQPRLPQYPIIRPLLPLDRINLDHEGDATTVADHICGDSVRISHISAPMPPVSPIKPGSHSQERGQDIRRDRLARLELIRLGPCGAKSHQIGSSSQIPGTGSARTKQVVNTGFKRKPPPLNPLAKTVTSPSRAEKSKCPGQEIQVNHIMQRKSELSHIQINVKGTKLTALIDSGSAAMLISSSAWSQIGNKPVLRPGAAIQLRSVTGNILPK